MQSALPCTAPKLAQGDNDSNETSNIQDFVQLVLSSSSMAKYRCDGESPASRPSTIPLLDFCDGVWDKFNA
jgi:hypothetical protein